ncbi:HNH endonuclease [Pseudomonas juntendi]|uniref:HNH endonuclease n=1 Tax=Pseudomonas juntendi TaxID=2666183 RepID=UPI0034D63AFF
MWKPLHVHTWEHANGPVPEGMIVAARDGDVQHKHRQPVSANASRTPTAQQPSLQRPAGGNHRRPPGKTSRGK